MTTKKTPDTTQHKAIYSGEVARRIGIGRTSFIRLFNLDRLPPGFPQPIVTTPGGPHRRGRCIWLEADIDAWLNGEGRA